MSHAISPAALHVTPPAPPPNPRQTKSTEEAGFAHQLLALLQPRAATPTTPKRSPPTPSGQDPEEPQDDGKSSDDSHAATTAAPSSTIHAAGASSTQSGSMAQTPAASAAHATPSPTDNPAAVDGNITALAGWIAMKAELENHVATLDAGHIASSEPKASASPSLSQAANSSDRSRSVPSAVSPPSREGHASEAVRESPRATSASSTSDTPEMESSSAPQAAAGAAAPSKAADAPQLPAGVTVVALSSASPNDGVTSSAKDRDASTTTADSTIDGAVAGALTATATTSDAGTSSAATPDPDAAGQALGPDVTSAVAANAIASAPSDRITVQLPTEGGSARIQIAVSNGTVVTRIMMPDAASAAHLSAASGELHDALARQGFDAVKIAVPAPPSSGPTSLGHSAEQSPDRTPDRAPQQSFTSAHDQRTTGRPQQRSRRQREG
jgi:hypothetical protein